MFSLAVVRRSAIPFTGVLVAVLYPVVLGADQFRLSELEYVAALVIVAVGLNIVLGYAGQLFLGPSAVFGVAVYAVAYVAVHQSWLGSLWWMLVIGALSGVLAGLVLGVPALRFGGFYLGMTTLYVATVLPVLVQNVPALGGSTGLSLIADPNFEQSFSGLPLYYIALLIVAIVIGFSWLLQHSVVGRRFALLATSEELSQSLGISVYRTKLLAFIIGSAVIGVGSGLYVHTQQFVTSGSAPAQMSILVLAACVVGGIGRVSGPVVGGVIVFGFSTLIPGLQEYVEVAFGILIIVVMILRPGGLVGFSRSRTALLPPAADDTGTTAQERKAAVPAKTYPRQQLRGALQAHSLIQRFGPVTAVDRLDITVAPGKAHGLVGPNGSGKTTTLNLLSGFLRSSEGAVIVGESSLKRGRAHLAARAGLTRTFQTPKLVVGATVHVNLLMAADQVVPPKGFSSVFRLPAGRRREAEVNALADQAAAGLGLAPVLHSVAGTLSHGTQRLVELARARLMAGAVVLLDEPAAGLSPAEVEVVKRSVKEMKAAGSGVLIVEHNLPVVFDLTDEVTVLDRGTVLYHGTPEQVAANPEVARIYSGNADSGVQQREKRPPQPADPGSTLEMRDLHAGYGAMEVVRQFNLHVRQNELVAIVGRNGVGKTTALEAIAGVKHGSNSGSVLIDDRDLEALSPWTRTAAGLALVPEGRHIFRQMTVDENLAMAAGGRGTSASDIKSDLDWVRELFPNLQRYSKTTAGSLSGGEQQMVAVAQALVARPRFLLLDEPTAGLAPILVDELFATLLRLRSAGVGVLVVDQNVERLLTIADRAFLMEDGRLVLGGPVESLSLTEIIDNIVRGAAHSPARQET
ncbi:MAG TPA: ATP-binding cassette domain-containing protein [Trebonia sp.]|jgi:ABC-type branched-subunit amino acid transport system ATPase component/ABC-type branched-subunit amino acid transport system permease subunit|nr:ATP-binding cassette domain-containing protein [Trebonia sp.]